MTKGLSRSRLIKRASPIAGFVALASLIGLAGYAFNEAATARLLEAEARIDAKGWSEGLSHSIPDLSDIIAGMPPSSSTYNSLELVRRAGQVSAFRVYDARGQLRLMSDGRTARQGTRQLIEVVDPAFAPALREEREDTRIRRGETREFRQLPSSRSSAMKESSDGSSPTSTRRSARRCSAAWQARPLRQSDSS